MCDDRLPLPRMQRCLCTELKTGCLIWGWTQLVLAILGISTLRSYSDNAYHHSIVYPTLGVGIVLSILLLVGLHSICSIIGVGTLNLYHHDEHYDGVIYPTLGTGIVLSIILLIGLHADIPILVQIYYFIILISIILMIISFIVYLIRGRIWGAVSFIIACIFYFVVVIYTRSCFYSMM
ncbi:uncharacterized protein LOC119692733 isoform X1 [Plutella xylostella]|uniref:uncharacterized protein LOC119692733 isoform X1 n=1 Tax=Plutella xylostella TaxID=51655 RepID=UPI0018D1F3EA|nr:uncharacterized protein LOC119692733 isoform X1 [Plutella xylostella]